VRFDGVNDHFVVTHDVALNVYDQDAYIVGVYAHRTDALNGDNIGVVYYKGLEYSPSTGLGLEANWICTSRVAFSVEDPPGVLMSASDGYNDDVLRLVAGYRYATNQAELRINGAIDQQRSVPEAYMDTTRNGFIGAQVTSEGIVWQPLAGIISELLIVSPATREELELVESYLLEKYALPATAPVSY
jgi:hypothetical protein